MADNKLPSWVRENVPDDAVWGEYFVIARKEEYSSGSRVRIEQSVSEPRDAVITGRKIKENLSFSASPLSGIALIVIGAVIAVLAILMKKPEAPLGNFIAPLLFAVGFEAGGIYLFAKSRRASSEIYSISSFEALEPYIEKALTDQVFSEEIEKRKKEHGDQGSGYAGYFVIPARLAAGGDLEKARSNFGLTDNIKQQLIQTANGTSEENRRLTRRK